MVKEEMLQSIDLEARYERYRNKIKDMTLMSDTFMRNVFKKRECPEYVLQVIMEDPELHIVDHVIQKDYKNLQGHSSVLDCVATDSVGKQYNLEVQQKEDGASPKRARYYSGLMDMNTLEPGQDYEELQESYMIFLTEDDVLGHGLPIYHIDRNIGEVGKDFPDEAHIIYINTSIQEDTELGRLSYDMHCKNADDMYSEILAARVRELKETPEGVKSMCREMEELYNEAMEIGEKRGIENNRKKTAKQMKKEGLSLEIICKVLQLSEGGVKELLL